jgi:dolichol-phosphate mannosyltransferase
LRAVVDGLPYPFGFIYVNDGSSDGTQAQLETLCAADDRVRVIELSRNFGHQAAITAGLDQADADAVITMDGDGEHPPEMIPEMLALAESGYEVVLAQRLEDQQASWFKRWTSNSFYKLINRIGDTQIQPGVGDFRLIRRNALVALKNLHEYHRFLRGMVSWMGYRTVILPYTPAKRIAGVSKFSLRKMLKLAMNAIFSFSLVPLYIAISLGGIFLLLALAEAIYVLRFWVLGLESGLAQGWSSLMFVLLIVGGTIMVTLGIIGIYLGYIFQEVKGRPVYLIRRILGRRDTQV